jgi:hypothetical protein
VTKLAAGSSGEAGIRWYAFADLAVVASPFFFYWFFSRAMLHPVAYPDSFAYLWDGPVALPYLTGRSLTTRLIYSACGLDQSRIAAVQLAITGASALGIQALLRQPRQLRRNLVVAAVLSLLFSSYTFSLTNVMMTAEPIFLSLLLLFPCTLFLARGPHAWWIVLGVGLAFVLSKNVAPYAVATMLVLRLLTLRSRIETRVAVVWASLALTALASVLITSRYDTSIHVNTFHNVTRRVLDTPGRPALFSERYGMPLSPAVRAFEGKSAAGAGLIEVDLHTRNFVLRDEGSGLTAWVSERGFAAYIDFLVFARPTETLRGVRNAWRKRAPEAVDYMTTYLGHEWRYNHPNNLESLKALGPGRGEGFLGFDPLAVSFRMLLWLGFGDIRGVIALGFFGIAAARLVRRPDTFALAGAGLLTSVWLYGVGFYGDAMEVQRHTAPAVVLATTSGMLLVLTSAQLAVQSVRGRLERAQ